MVVITSCVFVILIIYVIVLFSEIRRTHISVSARRMSCIHTCVYFGTTDEPGAPPLSDDNQPWCYAATFTWQRKHKAKIPCRRESCYTTGGLPIVELGVVQEGSMVPEDSFINIVDVCSSITVKYCTIARVVKGQQETKNLAHSRERYLIFNCIVCHVYMCTPPRYERGEFHHKNKSG